MQTNRRLSPGRFGDVAHPATGRFKDTFLEQRATRRGRREAGRRLVEAQPESAFLSGILSRVASRGVLHNILSSEDSSASTHPGHRYAKRG